MHIVIDIQSTWWFLLHKTSKGYKPTDSDCIWQYLYNVLRFRMRIMPRAVPCEWAQEGLRLNRTRKCISGLCRLHDVLFPFALYLILFLPSWLSLYIDIIAFSFSVSPTVGCVQHSTPQNMYVAEDQACCPPRPPLSRSTVLPCPRPPSSVHVTYEFLSVHVSANSECKLTFLSMTDTYVRTYIAKIDPSFKASR